MKKLFKKHGHLLSTIAVFMTVFSTNTYCYFWLHQPELPVTAKKYRKF